MYWIIEGMEKWNVSLWALLVEMFFVMPMVGVLLSDGKFGGAGFLTLTVMGYCYQYQYKRFFKKA